MIKLEPNERADVYATMLTNWRQLTDRFGSMANTQVAFAFGLGWVRDQQGPTISAMSNMTGLSRRTVQRALQELTMMGILHRNSDNTYRVADLALNMGIEVTSEVFMTMMRLRYICDRLCQDGQNAHPSSCPVLHKA